VCVCVWGGLVGSCSSGLLACRRGWPKVIYDGAAEVILCALTTDEDGTAMPVVRGVRCCVRCLVVGG